MQRFSKCFLLFWLGALCLDVPSGRADLEVSASVQIRAATDFQAPLAAHGTWIDVGPYGRCWRPGHVAVEWRPYGYGHWVWTDCGWYWVSDEPWAWACYHYGSWVYESDYGWIWVPGIEWAPAWVTWRVGGGHCGWAPLPPRGIVLVPRSYVFVETVRFHEPVRPSTVIVNNATIINRTSELAGLKRETRNLEGGSPQKVMINDGPGLHAIEKATGRKLQPLSIREAASRTPVPPEAVRKISESRKKDASTDSPEQSGSANDRKSERRGSPQPPKKEASADKGKDEPKDAGAAPQQRPPTPDSQQDRHRATDKGKGGGKGRGKGN